MIHMAVSYTKTSEQEIQRVEQEKGIEFPFEYKQFLLTFNGGVPTPSFFRFRQGPYSTSEVRELFGIGVSGYEDFEYNFNIFKVEYGDRIAPDNIPIGTDTAGNVILLTIKGSSIGAVSILMFGDGPATNEKPFGNIYFIAPSFGEFLKNLVPEAVPQPLSAYNQKLLAKKEKVETPIQDALDFGE